MGPSTPLKVEENKLIAGLRPMLSWCVKELVQSVHSPEEMVKNEHQTEVNNAKQEYEAETEDSHNNLFLQQLVPRSGKIDSSSRPYSHYQAFRKGYKLRHEPISATYIENINYMVQDGDIARRLMQTRLTQLTCCKKKLTYTPDLPKVGLRACTW